MVTLNTAIRDLQIKEGSITYKHFDFTNTPSGSYIVKWNSDEDKFEWIPNGAFIADEVPSGDINGVNATFTLAQTPVEGCEQVYLNGLLQQPGSSNDYTISGSVITFTTPPATNDVLLVSYVLSQAFGYQKYTPPPPVGYGYNIGGDSPTNSIINRVLFPFDSGTAANVGNLSASKHSLAGCNSSEYGFCGGGFNSSDLSTIERFSFPFDSGTSSIVGNLNYSRNGLAAFNNNTYGFFVGGGSLTYIERIQFPFDSGTASAVGNLSSQHDQGTGINSSNYGFCIGGDDSGSSSSIDRCQFPFDSGTASHVGNLEYGGWSIGGCNCTSYGYIGSLNDGTNKRSYIQRLTFPFDSGTANKTGNLSGSRAAVAGANSSQYGYFFSGYEPPFSVVSIIDRFSFPFDSGTASHVGNLTNSTYNSAAIDNIDFISIFI